MAGAFFWLAPGREFSFDLIAIYPMQFQRRSLLIRQPLVDDT
jgi:hypothetical protein